MPVHEKPYEAPSPLQPVVTLGSDVQDDAVAACRQQYKVWPLAPEVPELQMSEASVVLGVEEPVHEKPYEPSTHP